MENTATPLTVFKSSNPDELVVFHASSLQNEIRFYLNNTQYVAATEQADGTVSVNAGEDVAENKENKESVLTIIKKNFKELFILISVLLLAWVGLTTLIFFLSSIIQNQLIYLLSVNTLLFILSIVAIVVLELKTTPSALKSKHSAEHMMANFLEKNKRLPKDIEELKKSSRFCSDCGSRKLISNSTDEFISRIIASIVAVAASSLYLVFFKNNLVNLIIFCGVYFVIIFLVERLLKRNQKLDFITAPIKNVLTNLVQCANTTKKVQDKDLMLAYRVAAVWMQIVYPEFHEFQLYNCMEQKNEDCL